MTFSERLKSKITKISLQVRDNGNPITPCPFYGYGKVYGRLMASQVCVECEFFVEKSQLDSDHLDKQWVRCNMALLSKEEVENEVDKTHRQT